MGWQIKFRPSALKEVSRLSRSLQSRILNNLEAICSSPRNKGKQIKFSEKDPALWRYRVGDYRIICLLRDSDQTVLVLRVGHRKEVYRGKP